MPNRPEEIFRGGERVCGARTRRPRGQVNLWSVAAAVREENRINGKMKLSRAEQRRGGTGNVVVAVRAE